MTSEKQIEANRENAQLSTGPKTEEGIAISKMNALKHALLSKEVLLKGEDEESLIELGKRIRESLHPVSELEMLLTDRIIANFWRLKRVMEAEKAAMEWEKFDEDIDIDLDFGRQKDEEHKKEQKIRKKTRNMVANNDIELILRYETTIERGIYKALHELQRLQSARLGGKPPVPIAVDIDVSKEE